MPVSLFPKKLVASVMLIAALLPTLAHAGGGIVLGGTRVIYPAGQKEASISVRNTSETSRFMVQSWVEDKNGEKTSDFIVTPPLYVSNPGSENTLRLMYAGPALSPDRETLFYLTAKAIPAVDKSETAGKNVLMLSAATRIKLFVRPAGLKPSPADAVSKLTFSRNGLVVTVSNPTPYYITLTDMKAGSQALKDSVMVPPVGTKTFSLPAGQAGALSYRTINDYGGLTDERIWRF